MTPLKDVPTTFPWWPHSVWVTGNEIRKGRLGCVRRGRRIYVTEELLRAFIAEHTVPAVTK